MAAPRVTINSLPEKTSPTSGDLLVIQDGTVTKRMTQANYNSTLVTNGGNVSVIVALTQAAYDAIPVKSATTLYIIIS